MSKNRVQSQYSKTDCNNIIDLLFDVCEDLVFILDPEGNYIALNEYGPAQFDYRREEMLGQHFSKFISLRDVEAFTHAFSKLITDNSVVAFDTVFLSKHGKEIKCSISTKALKKGNQIELVTGIVKNIDDARTYESSIKDLNVKLIEMHRFLMIERSRSQQRKSMLEELNRLKSEFISNISHELRTPLASIIGFSETIASDPEMEVEMRNEFVGIILNEGKRLAKLVNDILDLTRMEEGGITLNKTEVELKKLLEKVVEGQQELLVKKGIYLSIEIPNDIILYADEIRLQQVFNDILNNSIKFTEPGGRVSILAQSLFKECEVIISDTGIGIPRVDLPNIFDKFYRVSRPGTEIPGTGLGLVLAKQIVDLHRGLITIQSEVDKGTSVIVKLPKQQKIQQL